MSSSTRNINMAAKVLLAITVILKFKKLITEVMHLRVNAMLGYDLFNIGFEIVFCILVIVFGLLTIMKRRYALIALFSLYIAKLFICLPINGNMSVSYYMGQQFANFVFDLGLFSIAMFFKSNGISGWRSILMSDKSLDNTNIENEPEAGIKDDKIEVAIDAITSVQLHDSDKIDQSRQVNLNLQNEDNHPHSCSSKILKYIVIVFAGLITISTISLIYIFQRSYPKYIESYEDKWKYTFKLPNNELAQSLYDLALSYKHTGYFLCPIENEENYIWRNYQSLLSIKPSIENKDIFAIKDTVNCLEDINQDCLYAFMDNPSALKFNITLPGYTGEDSWDFNRWERNRNIILKDYPSLKVNAYSLDSKWRIVDGKELFLIYNELASVDSLLIIHRIEPYNISKSLKLEQQTMEMASEVLSDNLDILDNIANYYLQRSNINKALDVFQNSISVNDKSHACYSRLSRLLYEAAEMIDAKKCAEKSLSLNEHDTNALSILAKIAADKNEWEEAKRLSLKAIDYGCASAEPYFIYAAAIGELGDLDTSHEYYNKGYRISSDDELAKKYEQYAGDPFTILYQEQAFTDSKDRIITDYGKKLYSSKSQWITTRAKFKWHRGGSYDLQVKFYCNGNLSSNGAASEGYTYESSIYNSNYTSEHESIVEIGGWGNSTPGNWPEGNYRIEIFYKGKMISSSSFILY